MATAIEAALTEIRTKTARIQEIKNELATINDEIERLHQAPVTRDDYKSFLPRYVALAGAEAIKGTGAEIFIRTQTMGVPPESKKGWRDAAQTAYTPDFMRTLNRASVFGLLCWFDPEQAAQKLSDLVDSTAPGGWGNDEYPTIAQRVQIIADKSARIATLTAEKDSLEAEIDGVVKSVAM